ncbi:uncharacterized WD repeat-containing protein all2124 isoform X2 [Callorhinchus milii]|uniref:Anaphase-promoting complex subunit 4-like WD40 domain-containing protein n=1 Tax=Callorhinchus milii TaxID=7868 RepID=V9KZ61_CALMI|nr:uncharacterized WD repeat-containing protein all2124 isoform X2 [Callorhinchus milii]
MRSLEAGLCPCDTTQAGSTAKGNQAVAGLRAGKRLSDMDDPNSCESSPPLLLRRKVRLSKDHHSIYALRFSADSKRLAVGFGNGAVQLLEAETGAVQREVCQGHRTQEAAMCISFHPLQPSLLLVGSADGNLNIYDWELGSEPVTISEENNEINALDFSLDGGIFATAGKDRSIRLYDSLTNQVCNVFEAPDVRSWDDLSLTSGHTKRIFALRFHPEEHHTFLTGGWDRALKVWDKRAAKSAQRSIGGPHICGAGIDIQGNSVVTASWVPSEALQLWDLRSLRVEKVLRFPTSLSQGQFLYTARFCHSDCVLAGGSGTSSAHITNINTNQVLGGIHLNNKAVQTLDSALGGQLIAVGGIGGNLSIGGLQRALGGSCHPQLSL